MIPISLPYGETVTVLRGTRDRVGDQQLSDHHTIGPCAFWPSGAGSGAVRSDDDRRDTSTVSGELAVPRTADLLATDHVRRADGSLWIVVGAPQWDMDHPMTGWDTGYKIARVKAVS
ncbi:hypothetical protein GV791_14875 [Nocardia cyriacigeorgica]|uniref:Head-to-tail stopper n=1 Tax=Nocardia cyriacigeorgica TaxID=135487 RepID=A0A6P1CMN2_9NOCA|nr:hypothetical protein [Nocardia cyriacigeorgica]NEW33839.1 hypothetical protein [Nocardia cyriacigeorgica]